MGNIQDSHDDREIRLDRVGVTGLVYPVLVPDRARGSRSADATVSLYVGLEPAARGVHMSRLLKAFRDHEGVMTREGIETLLEEMRGALRASTAHAEIEFVLFVERSAPVSEEKSLLACPVSLEASLEDTFDFALGVEVPVLAVCPCSIEATGGPAHSQRGHVGVSVRYDGHVWAEELIEMIEDSASAPVLPLLKGEDEKALLESAYANPVFVEDLVRNVAERLDSDVRVYWYRVEAENLESVHDHNAYACVERWR